MFRIRSLAAMSAFAVTVALSGSALAAQVLNFAHSTAQGSHYSMGVQAFAKKLAELSDGKYEIREQAAGALGGERDVIEGLQIGSVELTVSSTGPLGNFVPEALVLDLPFLFKDYANARAVLDGPIGQELPLFACMEMAVQGDDGKPVLPLFLDRGEAQQAVEDAMAADDGDAKLEIVGLSLHKALEQLVSQESSAFSFVPPASSLAHIQSYLENSGGVGVNTSPPS